MLVSSPAILRIVCQRQVHCHFRTPSSITSRLHHQQPCRLLRTSTNFAKSRIQNIRQHKPLYQQRLQYKKPKINFSGKKRYSKRKPPQKNQIQDKRKQGLVKSWVWSIIHDGPVPPNFYLRHEETIIKDKTSGPQVWLGLGALTSINIAVFHVWNRAKANEKIDTLLQHFTCDYSNLAQGRIYTLVTYTASHADMKHIVNNMLLLWFFGFRTYKVMGHMAFWALYTCGGIVASATHVLLDIYQDRTLPRLSTKERALLQDKIEKDGYESLPKQEQELLQHVERPIMGASGAIMAIASTSAALFPRDRIFVAIPYYPSLYFFLPLPLAVVQYVVSDTLGLTRNKEGRQDEPVAHEAHLAGLLVGAAYVTRAWASARFQNPLQVPLCSILFCSALRRGKAQLPIVRWLKRLF